ncbi:hypothetical protein QR77_13990 [Streptomyces sp. 150FB]|uniref:hypothetical protein n=1 Tax=Streptomyces sp. 150FB TaxID=1576605 RepID=UPI0005896CB2|nr:hypothetical protein [Streptomyces sp. 150FB]KIF74790.1 hypothetical protein QR77_13990 [Streptomyces sp. 150FB]
MSEKREWEGDSAAGSALRWPPCTCGAVKCPDYVAPECDVCTALVAQREEARRAGDSLTVRYSNRELSNHPHRRSGDAR